MADETVVCTVDPTIIELSCGRTDGPPTMSNDDDGAASCSTESSKDDTSNEDYVQ